jgi:hypothetical protein
VQTDTSKIPAEDRQNATKIAEKIKALQAAEGITGMEQCDVATRLVGRDPEKVLPALRLSAMAGSLWLLTKPRGTATSLLPEVSHSSNISARRQAVCEE